MTGIKISGKSDMGRQRTNNEDNLIKKKIWGDTCVVAAAIDGVGGYEGGEVAAEIAANKIVEYLETHSDGDRLDLLKEAVIFANNAIFEERKNQPQRANMSCVLTAALVDVEARRINMAHVGDTRLYQYCDNVLIKLSHDHSLVGYREEIGELTELEAMRHPQRNIIGRDVGSMYIESADTDYIEAASFPLEAKSILLFCSDGLCDMITSVQMKEVLAQEITLSKKVKALIDAANEAGGKDNVTVVLVETNLPPLEQQPQWEQEPILESQESVSPAPVSSDEPLPSALEEIHSIAPEESSHVVVEQILPVEEEVVQEEENLVEILPTPRKKPPYRLILCAIAILIVGIVLGGFLLPSLLKSCDNATPAATEESASVDESNTSSSNTDEGVSTATTDEDAPTVGADDDMQTVDNEEEIETQLSNEVTDNTEEQP